MFIHRFFFSNSDNLYRKSKYFSLMLIHRYNHNFNMKNNFVEDSVEIRTCGRLYKNWKKEKKFRTVPNTDLKFHVPFIDTHSRVTKTSAPHVVALHGAPGSYADFSSLICHLYSCGARIIAPNFPDFQTMKPGIFRHSDEEKAQYVKDFLKAIDVHEVDLLVCHSSAVYPGLHLCLENESLKVNSLVMLNPGTISLKMKATRYFQILKIAAKLIENPILLKVLQFIGPYFLKNVLKSPVRLDNCLDPMLSATCMVHADILKAAEKFHLLVDREFPILYIFSENDVLIGSEAAHELASLLVSQDSDIYYFDDKGILKSEGTDNASLKVMSFEKGSHYVFWKHPYVINNIVADFLHEHKKREN